MVGFGYSTNYGQAVAFLDEGLTKEGEGDQGAAVLHYTFSALSGRIEAEQTMGYRYWTGIGVPQNCQDALPWYKSAADKAIAIFEDPAGPPGGRHLPPPKVRLADVAGGVYGPGSSAISSHPGSHHHSSHAGHHHPVTEREWNDVLEFYQFHADRGDSGFMFRIGRIYYQGFNPLNPEGGSTLENGGRDFARALRWFMRIARTVWPRDPLLAYTNPASTPGKPAPTGPARQVSHQAYYDPNKDVKLKVEDSLSMAAGLAAGYLGRMYLRGEGFPEQDFQKAFLWFQRGIGQGDRESHNGLGIMYRDGLGMPVDMTKAVSHFQTAAQADHAEALVNLGKYHYRQSTSIPFGPNP
jgi:SEL1 protein